MVERAARAIGVPLHQLAIGVELDQLLSHLLDVLFDPRRRLGPGGAAKAVEPRDVTVGSAVPLDLVQAVERNIERVSAGEFQDHIIALEVLHGQALESPVLGDAMLDVDHVVAHTEVFQRGQERGRSGLRLWFVARAFGEQLLFRQEREAEVVGEESGRQIAVYDIEGRFTCASM